MQKMERRSFEIRAGVSEVDRPVSGIVVRYGDVADIGGVFREEFIRGSLRADDVTLNAFHDPSALLARTEGGGLDVRDVGNEFRFSAHLPDTTLGRDVFRLVRNRVLRGASIEMVVREDRWNGEHRTITRADVYGIALVARPAYSDSEIMAIRAVLDNREAAWEAENRADFFERYAASLRAIV